jgi:hypothetical protein
MGDTRVFQSLIRRADSQGWKQHGLQKTQQTNGLGGLGGLVLEPVTECGRPVFNPA